MKKERAAQPQHTTDEQIQDVNYWLEKTPEERLRAMLEINKRYNDQHNGPDQPFQKVFRIVPLDQKNSPHSPPSIDK